MSLILLEDTYVFALLFFLDALFVLSSEKNINGRAERIYEEEYEYHNGSLVSERVSRDTETGERRKKDCEKVTEKLDGEFHLFRVEDEIAYAYLKREQEKHRRVFKRKRRDQRSHSTRQ